MDSNLPGSDGFGVPASGDSTLYPGPHGSQHEENFQGDDYISSKSVALQLFRPRPELGDDLDTNDNSSEQVAANSPRYRRKSSAFIDGIHDVATGRGRAPAQLYSTMSGHLFHSGCIAIVMVGLPARGKTHIAVSIARYLSWLGVKTRVFHLGDYRRATVGPEGHVPEDYFFPKGLPSTVVLRQVILKKCREDIYAWLNNENGQVAIYDAVNGTVEGRRALATEFGKHDVQTLFVESFVDDERILRENARNVKISSPDFHGMEPDEAAKLFLRRIEMKMPAFETLVEPELNYIKMINAGEKLIYNGVSANYLSHRIVFYLTNVHIKSSMTYFVRAGTTTEVGTKADAPLTEGGKEYARRMVETLVRHREQTRAQVAKRTGVDAPSRPLIVWTSTRQNTIQTAEVLRAMGLDVRHRPELNQLNRGVCENLSENSVGRLYADEVVKHKLDPYHHRYPRAESYHDLAVRLEPIILELEREQEDLLVIAHESVLQVLYGYLMHRSATEIPQLAFPRDHIMEVMPTAYQNMARCILIPGLAGEELDQKVAVADDGEDEGEETMRATEATKSEAGVCNMVPSLPAGSTTVEAAGRAPVGPACHAPACQAAACNDELVERVGDHTSEPMAGHVNDED